VRRRKVWYLVVRAMLTTNRPGLREPCAAVGLCACPGDRLYRLQKMSRRIPLRPLAVRKSRRQTNGIPGSPAHRSTPLLRRTHHPHAVWRMLYGACCMAHAVWRMLYGACCMAHAVWRMLYGACCMLGWHVVWRMLYARLACCMYDIVCVISRGWPHNAVHCIPTVLGSESACPPFR